MPFSVAFLKWFFLNVFFECFFKIDDLRKTMAALGTRLVHDVQYKLEANASLFSKWFVDNHMKLNDAKCHVMLFGSKSPGTSLNLDTSCIKQSDKEELLGITLDTNLDLKFHVEIYAKKADQKLHALT